MKRIYIFFFMVLMSFTILQGCSDNNQTTTTTHEKDQLVLYTSLFPFEDFAKKIGGDFVEVETILPPGADAHTYEPSSKQMIAIANADAFIYNGLGMEAYAEKISEALANENVQLMEASHGIDAIEHEEGHVDGHKEGHEDGHEDGHEEGHEDGHEEDHEEGHEDGHEDGHHHHDVDPHIWLDPQHSITIAENIKNLLAELKPEAKEEFEGNFSELKEKLTLLDKEFQDLVESVDDPEMIVSHAAYGYWEARYGIHQIAVAGLSPSNEPSQKDLEHIIEIAREKQIKYVIFEQNVTPKVAEIIRQDIGAEPLHLHNLSVRTEGDIEQNEDYFSIMENNIRTLKKAFE
ncbi:zinc ABC transporter substrate-binding protein [Cytobacillus spongiae]|uniref:metal ABC transporter solute-binding protein, Zn/Mn family n=1 Tax=Cytobacillus spongiae TaxID=2901381 RepID=UPI001F2CA2E2|nr:zinc ABC transporter substrate-binding protein [Cytobacillus spongiae]UII54879.1 zinc ABC transporter substrate-binding protein [Cytobacillus spongiae]